LALPLVNKAAKKNACDDFSAGSAVGQPSFKVTVVTVVQVNRASRAGLERQTGRTDVRRVLTAAALGLGLGLSNLTGATAATVGAGIDTAAKNATVIEQAQYYHRCRSVRICREGPFGRRGRWEHVCR
jgi:hypothetical protein